MTLSAKGLTRKETLPEGRRGERFGRSEMMLFYRREDSPGEGGTCSRSHSLLQTGLGLDPHLQRAVRE